MNELLTKIQIIALILFGLVLLFCLILELWRGRKNNLSKNSLILEVSETFRKDLEKLIAEEAKINLSMAREKILQEHQKNVEKYRVLFEKLQKEFEGQNEEVKKQLSLFSQKINEEISQVHKISQETQDKISREAESKIINELTRRFEETHSEVSNLLLSETKNKVNELTKELTKEISNIYSSTQTLLEKEAEKTRKEIENYKKEKIKEIDQKIYQIIGNVAKKTIGKAIDVSTHEELVMTALEKAMKEIF